MYSTYYAGFAAAALVSVRTPVLRTVSIIPLSAPIGGLFDFSCVFSLFFTVKLSCITSYAGSRPRTPASFVNRNKGCKMLFHTPFIKRVVSGAMHRFLYTALSPSVL